MSQIQITVDESVQELHGDSLKKVERTALEIIVLDFYRKLAISAGRGAEILGLDLLSFIRWSGSQGILYFVMTAEDWVQELRSIKAMSCS